MLEKIQMPQNYIKIKTKARKEREKVRGKR
jgi:hypothetical protein